MRLPKPSRLTRGRSTSSPCRALGPKPFFLVDDRNPSGSTPDRTLERGQLYRLAWIFYLVLALAAVVWLGLRQGEIPLSLFVRFPAVLLDLSLGAGVGLALVALWTVARKTLESARRLEDELRRMLGPIEPIEILALALLSGFAEELFFRAAVQGAFGWVVATILFTVLHSGPGPSFRLWTLFAGIAGLVFAGLVLWRQSLLAAIVAHVIVNAVNLRHLATVRVEPAAGES